jgi:hypothetical protein
LTPNAVFIPHLPTNSGYLPRFDSPPGPLYYFSKAFFNFFMITPMQQLELFTRRPNLSPSFPPPFLSPPLTRAPVLQCHLSFRMFLPVGGRGAGASLRQLFMLARNVSLSDRLVFLHPARTTCRTIRAHLPRAMCLRTRRIWLFLWVNSELNFSCSGSWCDTLLSGPKLVAANGKSAQSLALVLSHVASVFTLVVAR